MTVIINMPSSSKATITRISSLSTVHPLMAYFHAWNISSKVVLLFSWRPVLRTYNASTKSIKISKPISIRCDHEIGQISISHTKLKAAVLLTGGLKPDSSGSTLISASTLQSNGTTVLVGSNSHIKRTGNATIHQT